MMALLGASLVAACLASVAVGAKPIPVDEVWSALTAPAGDHNDVIVRTLRIPRTVLGVLVGAALGLAGGLMQGHTRNPLADPGILGVNAGAAFGVVLAIHLLGITGLLGFIWFGFAGALGATALVYAVGSLGGGGATPATLALAGAAVSVFLLALVQAVILLDQQTLDVYRFWAVGGVAGRGYEIIVPVLPFLGVGLALAMANASGLNSLALGEEMAQGLGESIPRARAVGAAAIALLAGGAVAAAGPIAFLGLVVPHLARHVIGTDYRWLLPGAALLAGWRRDTAGGALPEPLRRTLVRVEPTLVSACLAGVPCRYNARSKESSEIADMVRCGMAVRICPEVAGGLGTPRRPAEIVGGNGEDVLDGRARVVDDTGRDVTEAFLAGAREALELAQRTGAKTAVLTDKSPSCGCTEIYDGTFSGTRRPGNGVTAALLARHGIDVRGRYC